MAETRRKFDADFREGAVRLVWETGKPIAQVARDLCTLMSHAGWLVASPADPGVVLARRGWFAVMCHRSDRDLVYVRVIAVGEVGPWAVSTTSLMSEVPFGAN